MPTLEKTAPARQPEAGAVPSKPPRAWWQRISQAIANGCALAVIVGIVDRITVRDSIDLIAPIFYALPPAMLAALSLLAMGLFAFKKQRKRFLLIAVFSVACLAYWTRTEFRHSEVSKEQGDVPIFFWNAASNLIPQPSVNQLHKSNASIIGMVEAGDWRATLEWYATEFPEYHFAHFGHGLVIGARGKISNRRLGQLGGAGQYALADIQLDEMNGRSLTAIVVDIDSNPFRSRKPAFDALRDVIAEQGDRPLVVMGDFNTPGDSVRFDSIRADFRDAFETAGEGWSSTWPVPVPVMAIDHIWLNRHFDIFNARLGWSPTSDHRPVVAGVSLSRDK